MPNSIEQIIEDYGFKIPDGAKITGLSINYEVETKENCRDTKPVDWIGEPWDKSIVNDPNFAVGVLS